MNFVFGANCYEIGRIPIVIPILQKALCGVNFEFYRDLMHCRNYFSVSYFSNYSKNILKIKSIQQFTNFVQNAGLFSFVFDKVFPNLWFATFAPCQNS